MQHVLVLMMVLGSRHSSDRGTHTQKHNSTTYRVEAVELRLMVIYDNKFYRKIQTHDDDDDVIRYTCRHKHKHTECSRAHAWLEGPALSACAQTLSHECTLATMETVTWTTTMVNLRATLRAPERLCNQIHTICTYIYKQIYVHNAREFMQRWCACAFRRRRNMSDFAYVLTLTVV